MKLIENIKKYFLICTLFIIIIITYNSRFEIIFKTFSMLGYDESLARKYSFSISERPFLIIKNKFNNILYSFKQKGEQLNVSLMIKKGFANYNSPNLEFKDGNYYLNIIDSSDIDQTMQKLEYSNIIEIYDFSKGSPNSESSWTYHSIKISYANFTRVYGLSRHKLVIHDNKILICGGFGKINDIPEFWNSKETSKPATTPAQANKYIGDSRAF